MRCTQAAWRFLRPLLNIFFFFFLGNIQDGNFKKVWLTLNQILKQTLPAVEKMMFRISPLCVQSVHCGSNEGHFQIGCYVCVFAWPCREFGRWKVNSLALEREDNGVALPLDPDFMHTIRQLGRRPTLGAITENIIRKYGTHFLLSATLGGTWLKLTVHLHVCILADTSICQTF